MDVGQARDFIYSLTGLPAMKAIKEHEETLEEISYLLDEVVTLQEHLERMPDFEPEDRSDREWIERLQSLRDNLKSYGDTQFFENIMKKL